MPRDAKAQRRARRSLPSAIERNLSLDELLGDDHRSARRKRTQEKEQVKLELMNAVRGYFAMIDQTELAVEAPPPAPSSPSPAAAEEEAAAVSDSELESRRLACRTTRTLRRRDLRDTRLQDEYREYCDATAAAATPLSIEEFAATIEPQVKSGMTEDLLDVCTPIK